MVQPTAILDHNLNILSSQVCVSQLLRKHSLLGFQLSRRDGGKQRCDCQAVNVFCKSK